MRDLCKQIKKMAAKSRPGRLEVDIEKYRGDGNWSRVLDIAKQLSAKSSNLDSFIKMVQTECALERFLLENPPTEKNIEKAGRELSDIQQDLQKVLSTNPKLDMKQEVLMLLAKVHYAVGDYQGALDRLDEASLSNISFTDLSSRKLKLVGECYAIKGLCLEKLPPIVGSRFRQAEREELIIQCFEIAGDVSLVQLQDRQERASATPRSGGSQQASGTLPATSSAPWNTSSDSDTLGVGPIVETAIQRSPILCIRNGELNKGIGRFRELLRVIETRSTQSLRQILARQLAEVLLRGVCERTYERIDAGAKCASSSPTHPKPRMYSGENLFVPEDQSEETLLLLLISESIATRETLLNRSPELTEARLHTFNNTTAVYDLLTIALVKRSQYGMLSETFERAMRFSCEEYHIWYQFALSLMCSEKYVRAFLVLKECIRMDPNNPVVYLQAAKLCYERLHMVSEGIEYCQKVVEMEESHQLMSRGYLFLGIGYSLKADEVRLQNQRQTFQKKAVEALMKSVSIDPNDYLAQFHLGLQMAILRQIPEALKYVRRALQRRSDHLHSLHLLALLLSAQKQFDEALRLVEATLTEYPDNFGLLITKCKLEVEVAGVENALQTCRAMLLIWKNLYEATNDSEERGTGLLERITSDHRSLLQLQLYELSDRDSEFPRTDSTLQWSVRAESMAATRLEQTLSEVASSLGSAGNQPRPGPQPTWALHTQIWLQLAELYLSSGKFDSAYACIQEAGSVNPVSHIVSYMRGRLSEAKGELLEAKKYYENATAINPSHMKSLHRLGIVLHALGNYRLAEKVVRDAVNYDPTYSQAWQSLGRILQSLDDHDIAADCLLTALDLETTDPVEPFSVIPKVFS